MKLSKLKTIRKSKGINQKDIAKQIGVSYESYKSYELGRRGIKIQTIKRIATILECTLDELI